MNRYDRLMKKAQDRDVILMDGATGTEIERRGVAQLVNAWNGGGAMSDPDSVIAVHEEYISKGAEVIISNTFANAKHALRDAGREIDFEQLNYRGVRLAIEAREKSGFGDVVVAGGVSYWTFTGKKPSLSELSDSVTLQCGIMKEAGADFLMLEMMVDIDQMLVTLDAANKSQLPVWIGLTCKPNIKGEICLRDGDSLETAIKLVSERNPHVINIMHTDVHDVLPALDILKPLWGGPIGVYAHSGEMIGTRWTFDDVISPESYLNFAEKWLGCGVKFIGGCCGINANHIGLLSEAIYGTNEIKPN